MAIAPERERPPQPVRWTREQYHHMGELGWFVDARVELVEGEIVEMSPVKPRHWVAVGLVAAALRRAFAVGFVVREETALGLGRSEPEPEVAVIPGNLRDFVDALPQHPVLVVEVADSSLDYDRATKRRLYARHAIPEYWILNLQDDVLEVYREPDIEQENYAPAVVLRTGDRVTPVAAPEVAIAVADLLP